MAFVIWWIGAVTALIIMMRHYPPLGPGDYLGLILVVLFWPFALIVAVYEIIVVAIERRIK